MTASRTYREAMPQDKALTHLSTLAGSLLDPTCFQALRSVVERGHTLTFIE